MPSGSRSWCPPGAVWPLPAYELALMTAGEAREMGQEDVSITVVTPEHTPLSLFGEQASDALAGELRWAGVDVRTGVVARKEGDGLVLEPSGERLDVQRVFAVPRLVGPAIDGLPIDEEGFILADDEARVEGCERTWAAGDGVVSPVKFGGLATHQARRAAAAIARLAGGDLPDPGEPVLHGRLLIGHRTRRLAPKGGGEGAPLWWPHGKVAGEHLPRWLAEHGVAPPPAAEEPPEQGVTIRRPLSVDTRGRRGAVPVRALAAVPQRRSGDRLARAADARGARALIRPAPSPGAWAHVRPAARSRSATSLRRRADGGSTASVAGRPPVPQQPVDRLGADERLAGRLEVAGIEDEGLGLRTAHAAVEGDQLLEGAALLGHRVVEAVDHEVGDVREPVRATQVPRCVGREAGQRVLAGDGTVGEPLRAAGADRHRPVVRRARHHESDVRVLGQRRYEPGVLGTDLLEREPVWALPQVDEPEVARPQNDHLVLRDLRIVGVVSRCDRSPRPSRG